MKTHKTVTLTEKDINGLRHAAWILEEISNHSTCWTAQGIREKLCNKDTRINDYFDQTTIEYE